MRRLTLPTVALLTVCASAVHAQEIDKAIEAYNADKHYEAAFLFYDVIQNTNDPDARVKAEYYIAQSLYKAGLYLPALAYYADVFNTGRSHPYFLKATTGLLRVGSKLGDDTLIPELINKGYGNFDESLQPSGSALNAINYLIGMVSQRRGNYAEAEQFLSVVQEKSALYVKAQYLLAIMEVKKANESGSADYSKAIEYFSKIEAKLKSATLDSQKKLYRMALLGKARAYYSQEDYKNSIEYYEKVPRFSDDWYDAMFESGWAYFQNAEFGKALGMVHSTQSPYFDGRYRAEAWVLKSTTYFQMCHFDRGRKSLEEFFKIYEPMADQLKPFIEGDQTDAEMVDLVQKGDPKFPEEIRSQLLYNRRLLKFTALIDRADTETAMAKKNLPEGSFKSYLLQLLKDQRDDRVTLAGKLVRAQIKREESNLEDFLNQARIIKFETADAERKMLEAGKDITKGPRAKGPRPDVPNSKFQYWAFLGEYWIDELGFYQHSIKNECLAEIFE
ncbi:MAG: hypothetical protein U1E65_23525 [Myxococcota bacterium]